MRLEHEGLVRRVAHCTDRRATVIETTPEGSKVGEQVWGEHCRAMSTLFDELSEVDRADLLRTVTRLHAVLERRMAAAGLNPSRCFEGPQRKTSSRRRKSRMSVHLSRRLCQRTSIDTCSRASRRSDLAGRLRWLTSIDAESTTVFWMARLRRRWRRSLSSFSED